MKRKKLYISGMTCINCQKKIESVLKNTPGITDVSVSYETGVAEFDCDEEKITIDQIRKQITDLAMVYPKNRFPEKRF